MAKKKKPGGGRSKVKVKTKTKTKTHSTQKPKSRKSKPKGVVSAQLKRAVIRVSTRAREKSHPIRRDHWVRCVVADGNIRAVAIEATQLVRNLAKRHRLSKVGAQGLGEAVVSAALIASAGEGDERVNLNIRGDGAFSQALVDATADGKVRGFVVERTKKKQAKNAEAIGPWGTGLLSVLRTKGVSGEPPYIGTVPLVTGHLAKDLTFYWFQSEQIPSAVGLGVYVENREVVAAAGFMIQAMPGANEAEVKLIQSKVLHLSNLKEKVISSGDPVQLLTQVFGEVQFTVVEDKSLVFACPCSLEKVERSLRLLGKKELTQILREDGKAVVNCDFCATEYLIKESHLKRLILASQ